LGYVSIAETLGILSTTFTQCARWTYRIRWNDAK